MQSILKMLPSVGPFAGMQQAAANVDESPPASSSGITGSSTGLKGRAESLTVNISPLRVGY
jgi:signal recognition particle subunit SRP54